jgi:hypothetical protein
MTDTDTRTPQRFCTYQRAGAELIGQVRGPNMLGEYMVAVSAEPNPEGGTRVGWAFAAPADFERNGLPVPVRTRSLP